MRVLQSGPVKGPVACPTGVPSLGDAWLSGSFTPGHSQLGGLPSLWPHTVLAFNPSPGGSSPSNHWDTTLWLLPPYPPFSGSPRYRVEVFLIFQCRSSLGWVQMGLGFDPSPGHALRDLLKSCLVIFGNKENRVLFLAS